MEVESMLHFREWSAVLNGWSRVFGRWDWWVSLEPDHKKPCLLSWLICGFLPRVFPGSSLSFSSISSSSFPCYLDISVSQSSACYLWFSSLMCLYFPDPIIKSYSLHYPSNADLSSITVLAPTLLLMFSSDLCKSSPFYSSGPSNLILSKRKSLFSPYPTKSLTYVD